MPLSEDIELRCEICTAFDSDSGECRRNSPDIAGWPKVEPHKWCLDFIPPITEKDCPCCFEDGIPH